MRSKAILMALLALVFGSVEAEFVTPNEAATAARALSVSAAAFGARLGTSVANVTRHNTTNDAPFYAVKMKEGGTVFLSGDTEDQPIIAFTACDADYSTIDKRSPLWALLNRDVSARKDLRAKNIKSATAAASWERLRAAGAGDVSKPLTAARPVFPSAAGGGDLRVDALVQSQWAQDGWDGTYDGERGGDPSKRCYSYYTPELRDGKHAVCGCVATAMSQVMRYHQYPAAAKKVTKTCFVEPRYEMNEERGNAEFVGETNLTTSAENFDWANMTLRPANDGASEAVCQAIGRLTADAGISVFMNYDTLDNGGSGSFMPNAATALRDVFQYQSAAVFSANEVTDDADALRGAFFANFDAGYPVLLGISGNGGHAIVADGYGFITELNRRGEPVTLPYVHLNMGWSGDSDFWYNLPDMSAVGFYYVDEVVFNIFPDKGGDTAIVSGRVLDDDGRSVVGATVKVFKAGTRELVTNVTTSATGVYGVTVPSSKNYDIEALLDSKVGEKADVTAVYTTVHDGTFNGLILDDGIHDPVVRTYSAKQATKVGNSWGNDVTISDPSVKVTTSQGEAFCTSLVKALRTAGELAAILPEGEVVDIELLKPVSLPTDWTIGFDCTIRTAADNPATLAVTRVPGAKLVVADATRVLFTNVVFSAGDIALRVEDGGIAALAGRVQLDEISMAANGCLEIAGPLDAGCSYRVRQDGGAALNTVFGTASVDLVTARAYANLFVNVVNDELVGVASDDAGKIKLAWGIGEVPDSAAVVRLLQNDTSVNFRSLASALKFVTNNAEVVVLEDCVLTTNVVVNSKKLTISSEEGAVISPSASRDDIESFAIENGGELVLSNVVFRGFSKFGEDGVAGNVFIKVKADSFLRMLDGAGLDGISNPYGTYGAVKVEAGGQVDLEAGSFIRECKSEKYGGAVYLAANAKLNLSGCSITGCTAATGGGVYAVKDAAVTVSGATKVTGNTQSSSAGRSNIFFPGATLTTCPLTVLDGLAGASVGVYYKDGGRAFEKGELAVFDAGIADEAKTSAADGFVNDLYPDGYYTGYSAYVSDDKTGLVWGPPRAEPGEVPEAEGKVVLDRAGKVMYFAELLPAFDRLTGGVARVTLKADVEIDREGDCPVPGQVTIDGAGYRIGRDNGCRLHIAGTGNALSLTNVTLTGSTLQDAQGGNRSVIRVEDGGLFVMEDGAVIRDVKGNAQPDLRTVAAVSIWNADFTMRDGSVISNCVNYCDSGAGGGVIVAGTNSVFRFEGGLITDCTVAEGTGAGVQIDNTSQFIVSGSGTITNNVGKGGVESNVYVSDLSYLLLADTFTGSIGYTEGIKGDTNVFGRVAADCPAALADQASSATNFFRDVDHSVTGLLVTNATESLLVWSNVVSTDESGNVYYEDGETGERYYQVEAGKPGPVPHWEVEYYTPSNIAFQAIERVSEAEWHLVITNRTPYCNYRLIWTDDLTKGFTNTGNWEHAVGPAADLVWTTNVVFGAEEISPAYFWRAEGTDGTNMVLRVEE